MLKPADNERLIRVGPGTPGGELMRRYWQPACLSSELPEPDCPPVRARLLGEDLLAFRDSDGTVGLVDAYCPHRRAPLFFGRNEECGIRCVYHGWKFDRQGVCTDMPSEPAGSPLQAKVRLKAYPTFERGGVVWTYMGPAECQPSPPNYEWLRAPATHRFVSKTLQACNYLQAMEGGLDTAHSSFLHNNKLLDRQELRNRDRSPRIEVGVTDYGYWYSSRRTVSYESEYVRLYQFVMPNQQIRGTFRSPDGARAEVPKLDGHVWVPVDDETCLVYNWGCGDDETVPLTPEFVRRLEKFAGRGEDDYIPGTFKLKRNLSNDFLIDRQQQKMHTYTGITGLNTQDMALQEGMGPIVDRSKEFLGSSDRAIVTMRRIMLEAIGAVEQGMAPRGADPALSCDIRAYDDVIPKGSDPHVTFGDKLKAKW
jgi:phenylpropionate dioxygenase-like ring-hydroxylating dioxygenase large terminal subunit